MPDPALPENESRAQLTSTARGKLTATAPVPCYFLALELENVRAFKTRQRLSLTRPDGRPARWTVLLGDNGMGKTTVLQCLAEMRLENRMEAFIGEKGESYVLAEGFISPSTFLRVAAQTAAVLVECSFQPLIECEPESVCTVTAQIDEFWPVVMVGSGWQPFTAYGYGALRRLGKGALDETRELDSCATLFDDEKTLMNVEEWLREADYAAAKSGEPKAKERLLRIVELLKELLPDLENIRIEARGTKVPLPEALTPFGWIPVRALSTGYRSVVAWVVDFASRLLDRYPDEEKPFHGSAIVLVDQIDLYLHPKWQREMMERLSRIFPNTQFVVTAHSPLIVQAVPNANVAVLRRVGDEVHILNNPEDIRGWRTDQLLASELFEHQPTRDADTEKLLAERRILLEKHPRTPEEEARLSELEKKAGAVPEAESAWDIEAMKLIRDAAENLRVK